METTDTTATDTRQNRAAKLARLRMVMAQMEASKIAITPVLQQVESRYWPNILAQAIVASAPGMHCSPEEFMERLDVLVDVRLSDETEYGTKTA
jgi:hypothetical protein